jgi:hypothetical protein
MLFLRCLCKIICRLRFGTAPATEESKKADATQLLFLSCLEAGMQVPLVTMSHPSLRTFALPLCLPLGIKDFLKEDTGLFG